jgi:2-isopropylmalate synthase
LDSTLRDGAQGEGISFSVSDKLNIVKALDSFGIDYIEAGNPDLIRKIWNSSRSCSTGIKKFQICAFGSTCRNGVHPKK